MEYSIVLPKTIVSGMERLAEIKETSIQELIIAVLLIDVNIDWDSNREEYFQAKNSDEIPFKKLLKMYQEPIRNLSLDMPVGIMTHLFNWSERKEIARDQLIAELLESYISFETDRLEKLEKVNG